MNVINGTTIHILVSDDEYVAFVQIAHDNDTGRVGYRAMVPNLAVQPRGKETPDYHYTHDTLQEAKDWCIAELWKRRLEST